jgi:hypothetical protein
MAKRSMIEKQKRTPKFTVRTTVAAVAAVPAPI